MELVPVRCRIPELLVRRRKMESSTSQIKINQQWLADKIGISKQQMSDYINLRSGYTSMSIQRAALIAYHLDCLQDDLFVWEWR
ncbi:helix-turn-helix domain-containing protein [Paenibacillus sp. FSL R7-0312]|uniref:helix-turn-helix domain-containing protein n=1 Tax=Paenibacillus sp. FSL R7-0312 TaxID=2921682 RepID=UPI0030FCBF0F